MNRRRFLQNLAVTTASIPYLSTKLEAADAKAAATDAVDASEEHATGHPPDIEGHTLLAEFKLADVSWKAYEDLRTRDGVITFISSQGGLQVLPKSAEATFEESDPPYL